MARNIFKAAYRLIEAAGRVAKTRAALWRVEEVNLCDGYAEPGYASDAVVAFGNWNTIGHWDAEANKHVDDDYIMSRLCKALERIGVEIEWSDEWTTCDACNKAVRTQPDSYGWKRAYSDTDDGPICHECIDAEEHLQSLEGEDRKCNTIDSIDPAEHGYVLVEGGFEHVFHAGQDADPKRIGKALRAQGIERYLFDLTGVGQFDSTFAVYVHEDEASMLNREAFDKAETDGPSVSAAMERGLREATVKMGALPDGQGVKFASIQADGTAEVRVVSPAEFIAGIKR